MSEPVTKELLALAKKRAQEANAAYAKALKAYKQQRKTRTQPPTKE